MFEIFFFALSFVFGASIGSFVGVIVDRLHVAPIVHGRSKCLTCGKHLSWKELVPIVSFVFQRGKCKNCGSAIGALHLITELVYGVLFVLLYTFLFRDMTFTLAQTGWCIYYTILFVVSGVLVLYDLRHRVIPSEFLYAFMGLSFFMLCVRYNASHDLIELASPFVLSLPFLFLFFLTKKKGVGFGDILLLSGIGMLLGPPSGFAAFLIAIWSAALMGVILQIINRRHFTRKYALPFVPFLILGTLVVLFTDISMWDIVDYISRYTKHIL